MAKLFIVYVVLSIAVIGVLAGFLGSCYISKEKFCNCFGVSYNGAAGNPDLDYYANQGMIGTPQYGLAGTACYNPPDLSKAYFEGRQLPMWAGVA